ncbi:MAG: hypothetical protein F4Z16_06580 [Rhodothermaceae bacterium]|nr:hypothetical protein [Rhodothermaceae bacterium]
MGNPRMMIRFLDLTLLLLLSFLFSADFAIERAVGLPHGTASNESTSSDALTLRVMPQSWVVSERGAEVCSGTAAEGVQRCLQPRVTNTTNILVSPVPGVRVQRLVDMLDICSTISAQCSVGSL